MQWTFKWNSNDHCQRTVGCYIGAMVAQSQAL